MNNLGEALWALFLVGLIIGGIWLFFVFAATVVMHGVGAFFALIFSILMRGAEAIDELFKPKEKPSTRVPKERLPREPERQKVRAQIDHPTFQKVALSIIDTKPYSTAEQLVDLYHEYKAWLPEPKPIGQFQTAGLDVAEDEVTAVARVAVTAVDAIDIPYEHQPVPDGLRETFIAAHPDFSDLLRSPFWRLLQDYKGSVSVPLKSRFEGTFILAPPGSGKTTLMEYLATRDMEDGSASVVVMDSQSTIIKELSSLKHIQDRIVLIEPGAVAMNPFSMKGELGVDLITFILAALGGEGSALTAKQSSFYRPCVRLLQEVPNATFIDFYRLLQPDGLAAYAEHLPKLSETVQLFFQNEFNAKPASTKEELLWRLRPITEDPVYEKMFSSPDTKLDLFKELDAGKVILIDTDKHQLQAVRSSLFGRMFVAFMYRAIMQRRVGEHAPVFWYIDEAHEYLQDDQIADMLDEVRKRRVAITLATQRLEKIKSVNMKSAVLSTAVKYVRAGNDSDAHAMAREVRVEKPADLLDLPPRSFALFVRDHTPKAVPITVPDFDIKRDFKHVDTARLKQRMREQYGPDDGKPTTPAPAPAVKPKAPAKQKADTKPKEW